MENAEQQNKENGMRLGIMSGVFRKYPVEEAARRIRAGGFDCTQLNPDFEGMPYSRYGSASDLTGFTPALRARIRKAFEDAGVEVLSQGAYMELTGEDEAQRRQNIDYFAARLRMMREMGGEVLVTESGRRPEDPAAQRAAWDRLRAALAELLPIARAEGVAIGLEPSRAQVLKDTATAKALLDEFGTDHLKVMIDPANILGLETLDEMFANVAPAIFQGHAKDVLLTGEKPSYPPAGRGEIDYPHYVRLLAQHRVPALVIEYVTEANFPPVRDFLRTVIAANARPFETADERG
jgi:sugar phosphate isomerase/epimerase